jgi:hypothetical protein
MTHKQTKPLCVPVPVAKVLDCIKMHGLPEGKEIPELTKTTKLNLGDSLDPPPPPSLTIIVLKRRSTHRQEQIQEFNTDSPHTCKNTTGESVMFFAC